MLMGQSVEEFFKDREEYLKRPTIASIGNADPREWYTEGIPQFVKTENYYFFKDEEDNEYSFPKEEEDISEKEMWQKFDEMKANGDPGNNVKDIIIEIKRKREESRKRTKEILKHVAPFFIEEKPFLVKKAPIELVLSEFVSYWYRHTGCRGIINKEKVKNYIEDYLTTPSILELDSTEKTIEQFEKKIRKDGGVVEIS